MPSNIDKSTKINLGLILTLIPILIGAGVFVNNTYVNASEYRKHITSDEKVANRLVLGLLRLERRILRDQLHHEELVSPGSKYFKEKTAEIEEISEEITGLL